jgi:hypothetical protein
MHPNLAFVVSPFFQLRYELPATVCNTLVFQSSQWGCALYGIEALLAPVDEAEVAATIAQALVVGAGGAGAGAGGAAAASATSALARGGGRGSVSGGGGGSEAQKNNSTWLTAISAANGIGEVVEAVRRHVSRVLVCEPGCRLLRSLCCGRDMDADRRRVGCVDADGVPILLEVLSTHEMYDSAGKFFDPKVLGLDTQGGLGGGGKSSLSANPAKRKAQQEARLLALMFRNVLGVFEALVAGTTKASDERRIKLIGVVADEMCDLVSSNANSGPAQELGFRVLAAYVESTKRGVADAFVEDCLAAGANTLAVDFLSSKAMRQQPEAAVHALRLCANLCKPEAGEQAEDARSALVKGKAAKHVVAWLTSPHVAVRGTAQAEALALQGCRALLFMSSGFYSGDRMAVVKAKGPEGCAAALRAHPDSPIVVSSACDALRVLALETWKAPRGAGGLKRPSFRDMALGLDVGSLPSEAGRAAVLAAKAHIAVCVALGKKEEPPPQQAGAGGGGADQSASTAAAVAAAREAMGNGPSTAVIGMFTSAALFLGAMAMDSGKEADACRDALMACNAHKLVIKAMHPTFAPLKQSAKAMVGCMEAVRHFAGSGENSTSLMRRECMARGADKWVVQSMKVWPNDMEVQRAGSCALRNLSFGGRGEGEIRRAHLIEVKAHTQVSTALRHFMTIEHEPERQIHSTALYDAAFGLIRNMSFGGGGGGAEDRRRQLFGEKADELLLTALTVTKRVVDEAKQRHQALPLDSVAATRTGLVALGNLVCAFTYCFRSR